MIKSTSRSKFSSHQSPLPSEGNHLSILSSSNREQKRLRAIFHLLHEAVLLVDAKGKISFYNHTAQQLLALPEKTKRIPHLWHWIPTLKSFFTQSDPNTRPDALVTETELTYPEKRFIRLQLRPFSEADGRPLFIVLLQDITQERTQSEEQLFQGCLDSVTQLASELAHELGNPLNAIGIHLQLVQRALKNLFSTTNIDTHSEKPTRGMMEAGIISPKTTLSASKNIEKSTPETCATFPICPSQTATLPITPQQHTTSEISDTAIVPIAPTTVVPILEQQSPLQHFTSSQTAELFQKLWQSLSVCQSEVQRLDALVQQFLKSVRPQSLELKRGNVLQPLKKVLAVLKPQLDDAHITVELHISNPLSSVFMDADRLHQAFFNVLKNAREAIGTNGKIAISCKQDERYLILAFADSGGGFQETQAIQLFSQSHTTQKPNGHGIGMLIVQRIMREHNGFVEIQTKASVGSVVSLKFPLSEPMMRKIETQRSKAMRKKEKGDRKNYK